MPKKSQINEYSDLETRHIMLITTIDQINTLVLIQYILERSWVDFYEVERHEL